MRLEFAHYLLDFKQPAGTSRGILKQKDTCFIKIYDETNPEVFGIGEAAVFPGLSLEANETFVYKMMELLANVAIGRPTDLSRFPSIQFGFEQAIRDFSSGGKGIYFDSPFVKGESEIEINGLIWMGDFDTMVKRVDEKVGQGFRCIKLKIGAIDWNRELEIITTLRSHFPKDKLEIRVDANGAFSMENVFPKLAALARLDVHSIEQPIKAGFPELMAFVCKMSPVPVALDEELIGKYTSDSKIRTLEEINPGYIILKPALCGGFSGAEEWIKLAEERNIGWWVTSALESNVGLSALTQWVATLGNKMPQGLGTGQLFTNNFISPLTLKADRLSYNPELPFSHSQFDNLDWKK